MYQRKNLETNKLSTLPLKLIFLSDGDASFSNPQYKYLQPNVF